MARGRCDLCHKESTFEETEDGYYTNCDDCRSYFLSKEVLREFRGTPVWDEMRSVVGRYSARYNAEHPNEMLMIRTPAEFRDFYNLQLGIERG